MSEPTNSHVPTVVPTVVEEPTGPSRTTRAKKFVKSAFTHIGVPVVIGTAAAYFATHKNSAETSDESNDTSDTSE